MAKNKTRFFIVLAILFAVFTVIAIALPLAKTATFWLSYIFAVIALAVQIYAYPKAFAGESVKSKFYGFPIARITTVYLIAQLALSLIFMLAAKWVPAWIPVILFAVLLGAAAIGFITAEGMRDEVERQDVVHKADVGTMRALQSKARAIAAQCEGDEARKALARLSDDLSYSDPVSSPAIADAETELAACIDNLQQAVVDGSEEEILTLCRKAAAALAERNRLCKLNKG